MIFVIKEIVLMHAESQVVEVMLDVKIESTAPPVFACPTMSEIQELLAIDVSRAFSD